MAKKNVALDEKGYRKFGIRDSVAYAAGDLRCNMSFALKSTMAIFWTQFTGLDLWYSLLLIIVQVWDAINAPPWSAPWSTPIAFSAVMQFIGLSLVYNLDKKTTAKMTEELNARHEAAAK